MIVEEVSTDSDPLGAYVRVAKTKQDGGKRVKGDELGWTAAANLVDGWTEDIHSATSTWEGGAFTGQIDVVDIVDEGGDTERASEAGMSPFRLLQQAAATAGHDLQIESGFRTYEEQRALRAKYLAGTGNKAAEAGRSNHQNGIALDLNTKGFDTAIYEWMTQHAPTLRLHPYGRQGALALGVPPGRGSRDGQAGEVQAGRGQSLTRLASAGPTH